MKASYLTRRRFLNQLLLSSGACATFPEIIPSNVLSAAEKPSNRLTIGFIGTGRQCIYANIPGFLREKDAQCVAVCDVDSWRMEFAKKSIEDYYAKNTQSGEFKGCATFRDWRELINRRDIDVVMISTPDHWHVPMAISAINGGKDICCEKPLTRNISEGRKLSNL
jgi:predicted dehydrogenase